MTDYKVWHMFKNEADSSGQLSFDFAAENEKTWVGPFHFHGEEDSENMLKVLYKDYDSKNSLIYKITGTFKKNGS